jgi:simple sugar transport system ATP-binding protein
MRIELLDICKRFGRVQANDGITLTIQSGTIHGLLGENGAGKTTLMKILSGYQSYDSGRIALDGQVVRFGSPADAIAAGIGMLHQDPMDVPALTVLDNYCLGHGRPLTLGRRQARADLERLCQRFGFQIEPGALASSLSVGERQQLELVRLLGLGARTIILDEPTTGISAPQKALLFDTLRQLAAEGYSIIFVSHKLDDVEELCSEVTVLRQGRISGQAEAPLDQTDLVRLMFGQCLSGYPRVAIGLGAPVLELHDVSIHTYRLNVDHISLTLRAGEVVGLAGLEGSGQRILMQACAGLQHVRSGRVLLGGVEMTNQPYVRHLRAGVAYVPAARLEEGMVGELTIREHMALTDEQRGLMVPWPRAQARSEALIGEFNIIGRPETPVRALSGGNQQRTLLALLPDDVRLLIMEHPTRGLDMESTQWVWSRLLQRRQQGTAILFTSTDLDELVENSDCIVVFSGGRMSAPLQASSVTCEQLGYLIGGRQP